MTFDRKLRDVRARVAERAKGSLGSDVVVGGDGGVRGVPSWLVCVHFFFLSLQLWHLQLDPLFLPIFSSQ